MTHERNHAILFAATLLSARKIIDALDSSRPNPGKEKGAQFEKERPSTSKPNTRDFSESNTLRRRSR